MQTSRKSKRKVKRRMSESVERKRVENQKRTSRKMKLATVTKFGRPDTRGSVVDVTLATLTATCRIRDKRVLEDYTASDHQYVTYTIQERGVTPPVAARRAAKRWNAVRLDKAALRQALETASQPADLVLYTRRKISGTHPIDFCSGSANLAHLVCQSSGSGNCVNSTL